ncbi:MULTISPECIES: hypothetical protein [Brevibacillus]|jgi:negative regulator of sigma E activity|uniref:Uncharacterized protein n=1 Tax=Brevibacillus parabrevis TaxID=54914 RepID=A0A4Y3PL86_BREPA|nr:MULTISPECIES: hypothetical protein [Brevibacillus]MBU8714924.1 hypothetical protein [Brevibacillus parabrevis]MDH6352930.1 negative regulator of sigma E activity [Brevibacillus sp. 1238]MED2253110.1 hypothetical protein [Brevibacillus parabrevis]RNB95295.1 hypothetical protein EDM60_11565 [Brevibacillus parabrevis]UED71020.1 hypothetical protein HP435_10405 [Brevibacillus sp. HD3.3A]
MTNEEIWECMQRDLDGDLSVQEQQVLRNLIQKDADLQLMYNRLKTVSQKLEQLPPVVPSISIVDSILPRLESAAAKPAVVQSAVLEESLPTLEVKRKSSSLAESKKWKRVKVWLAGIGSTAVAACLLVGVLFSGSEEKPLQPDAFQNGADSTPPVVTKDPVVYGPEAPTPSTNPSPLNKKEEEKKSEKAPPKKQTHKPPAKTEYKPPAKPPAANATPPNKAPANVPKPVVVTEDKPPSFPVGLEEKSDEDDNKSAREKDDGDKDEEKDNKKDNKQEERESNKENDD